MHRSDIQMEMHVLCSKTKGRSQSQKITLLSLLILHQVQEAALPYNIGFY